MKTDGYWAEIGVCIYSVLEGPFEFDSSTLVSALRIAMIYDYPTLRAYSIKHIEQAQLPAVERVKLGREFRLTLWEQSAFYGLCMRDEAITMDEASMLGLQTLVRLAQIREKEQCRRGKGPRTWGQTRI